MHELDKYLTLSEFSKELNVSIPRVTRLMEVLKIETHSKGGAILAERVHLKALKKGLRDHVIKRGRKKGPKEINQSAHK